MAVRWRWLVEAPPPSRSLSGPWNMGLDEAMLERAARSDVATLRLYRWSGPWLSTGYAQGLSSERLADCRRSGVGVVRRATGGRAVLHGCDLTYSVAAPVSALPASLRASYDCIAEALLEALTRVGVRAERSPADAQAPGRGVFDCFEAPAADEICVGGRKLAGSAQRRGTHAFLQHGSIRLAPDPPVAARAAGLEGPGATSLVEEGHADAAAALERALRETLPAALGARPEPEAIGPAESERAADRCRAHQRDPLSAPSELGSGGFRPSADPPTPDPATA